MPIAIKILFLLMTAVFSLGTIGEKEHKKGRLYLAGAAISATLLIVSEALF